MTLRKGDRLILIDVSGTPVADSDVYVVESAAPVEPAFKYGPITPADPNLIAARLRLS